jgi:uncharacterized FlaG/YvyC family protein
MDLDRTSLGNRPQDLRALAQPNSNTSDQANQTPASVAPEHGGPLAGSQVGKHRESEPDANAEAKRQQAQEVVSRFLKLPSNTKLDILVDTKEQEVTVQIRNKETGELIKEVPERDAKTLFEQLREINGALLDRSF